MANSRGWELRELSDPPGWGRKKRANAPSFVSSHNRIVRFFVSVNVFLCNSARILIKTARHDDTSLWLQKFIYIIKFLILIERYSVLYVMSNSFINWKDDLQITKNINSQNLIQFKLNLLRNVDSRPDSFQFRHSILA